MANLTIAALLVLMVARCSAAISKDEVTALPGWDGPLPSKHYSGYLNVTGGALHYWFIESENNSGISTSSSCFDSQTAPAGCAILYPLPLTHIIREIPFSLIKVPISLPP